MRTTPKSALVLAAATASLLALAAPTVAQMSNKPFSFSTPGSNGVGMSLAARQAILGEKLFDFVPRSRVVLRGPSGEAFGVFRGPGRSAIVTDSGGAFVPGYRRPLFGPGLSAGAFNAYFAPRPGVTSLPWVGLGAGGDPVGTWTGRVISQAGGAGLGPVDGWTGYVYGMGPRRAYAY